MMMSADKVGGWVKKGQNHHDVILEWSLTWHEHRSKQMFHGMRGVQHIVMLFDVCLIWERECDSFSDNI